ncbi:YidH family protein [Leucobacter ruminantium]|uniref:YidH family protein n=1 Tax=Leucobacter ruminantium TaxID=1289170 RepID=UPI003132CC92
MNDSTGELAVPGEDTPDDERGRLSRTVFPGGTEPDPRFTLANERTFLAWIRTALAFIAGGIAFEALTGSAFEGPLRLVISMLLVVFGLLIAAGAAVRWWRVEQSMRRRRPLPVPLIVPVMSAGLTAAVVVLIVLVFR